MSDSYQVTGDWRLKYYVEGIDREMRKRLRTTIQSLIERIASKSRAGAPRGATGDLASKISTKIRSKADRVVGIVYDNAKYANVIEEGLNKTLDIAAYARTIKVAFGRPINPVLAQVSAHKRDAVIEPHPFLRVALEDFQTQVFDEIADAAYGAFADAKPSS